MLAGGIIDAQPDTILVAPDEARSGWGSAVTEALHCRLVALTFGLISEQLVSLLRTHGVRRVVAVGNVSTSLLEALAGEGADVRVVCLKDALADAMVPGPVDDDPCGLAREQARERLDAPPGVSIELAFPSAGTNVVLAAISRIEALPAAARPLLLLPDDWGDAERIRQYAVLRGVGENVRFCGPVPDEHRAALIVAANLLHISDAAGSYRGEAARTAWINGTPMRDSKGSEMETVAGDAADWSQWAIAQGPPTESLLPLAAQAAVHSAPIAVFLPTWRCRDWLPEAIASVVGQSHGNFHLFVCDDGGEDLDAGLLALFPQVTFLATGTAQGPYAIANMLAAITRSEFIAFQDADDISDSDRLSVQLNELLRLGLDAVGCNSRVIDIEGALVGVEVRPPAASLAIRACQTDLMLHPTSLFRRRVLEELGGFDSSTRFGADTELHFRAALTHDFGNVQKLLYTRRERPSSLTQSRSTGFGSIARASYSDRVKTALEDALASGVMPPAGYTLTGLEIAPPDLSGLHLIQPGNESDRWLHHARAARMRR